MNFCLNMFSLIGKSLSVFQKRCLSMPKSAFLKKNDFERSFYQIKVQLVINSSSRRLQQHQILENSMKADVLRIFLQYHIFHEF